MNNKFEIKDILSAVETISKIERKDRKISSKKALDNENDVLSDNNQAKSSISDILVLDEMIE